MIPTTDSMKTIGIPASVSATKITAERDQRVGPDRQQRGDDPPDDRGDRQPRRARASTAVRAPWRGSAISRVAPRSTAAR